MVLILIVSSIKLNHVCIHTSNSFCPHQGGEELTIKQEVKIEDIDVVMAVAGCSKASSDAPHNFPTTEVQEQRFTLEVIIVRIIRTGYRNLINYYAGITLVLPKYYTPFASTEYV